MEIIHGCDDGDIFKISGVYKVTPCSDCHYEMYKEDLIYLVPEKEDYIN
jgi:NAD-dependent SIR2 family protein deacetylase